MQQENKQLKDNWDELKEYIGIKLYNVEYLQKLCGCRIDDEIHIILDIIKKKMQELENRKWWVNDKRWIKGGNKW